jgi:hypothetical protein
MFGITTQTSCTKKLLVQPTAIANQTRLWYTRVPFKYTTLVRLRTLFPTYQLPRVGSYTLRDYGDSGPDSTPDSPWTSSTSSSPSGPGMTGSGGGAAIASVDFLAQAYTGRYAATGNSAHV